MTHGHTSDIEMASVVKMASKKIWLIYFDVIHSALANSESEKVNPISSIGHNGLTPKEPNCIFWQHSNLGQLTTNGIFLFLFLKISHTIHKPEE